MRPVPWWALLSSGTAPVLLTAGWTIAGAIQGPTYDPVKKTISILAAYGAPGYWVMTSAVLGLGTCHVITALGLHPAAPLGRLALAAGGVCAILLTVFPAPPSGGSFPHGTVVAVGFALLAVWPVLAVGHGNWASISAWSAHGGWAHFSGWGRQSGLGDHNGSPPWALRTRVAVVASALMWLSGLWFVITLQTDGPDGIAERVLTTAQTVWPLFVVSSCLYHPHHERQPAKTGRW
ncbi:DUF998 domain-containing protein [Streptomyces sp. NBC_00370]|uniref:DUF998 domain-containing protein n=1 Tax=Streptomyces sp. NBC_00370 TaxID=2975728 RepID=UPI002E2532E2